MHNWQPNGLQLMVIPSSPPFGTNTSGQPEVVLRVVDLASSDTEYAVQHEVPVDRVQTWRVW